MRRRARFERLGYFFESIGRIVERPTPRDRDPIKRNVRQACRYLIVLAVVIGAIAITYFVNLKNPRVFVVLGFDLAAVIVAVVAMKVPQPVKSFLWLLLSLLLLGFTFAAAAWMSGYI